MMSKSFTRAKPSSTLRWRRVMFVDRDADSRCKAWCDASAAPWLCNGRAVLVPRDIAPASSIRRAGCCWRKATLRCDPELSTPPLNSIKTPPSDTSEDFRRSS